jgi:uncharacterized protein YyaL (SSP411 family)
MEHESFEDAETAAAHERPLRQREGGPRGAAGRGLHLHDGRAGHDGPRRLAHDGLPDARTARPFYGGTYFPPEPRHGLPSFRQVLQAVADAYRERRGRGGAERCRPARRAGSRAWACSRPSHRSGPSLLDEAFRAVAGSYDAEQGGFGGAPKFPQPMSLEFLLRTTRGPAPPSAQHGAHTLRTGWRGADVRPGRRRLPPLQRGRRWLVPHFEKMLYDNALLARLYFTPTRPPAMWSFAGGRGDAGLRAPRDDVAGGRLLFGAGRRQRGGGGKFYVWTPEEVDAALGRRGRPALPPLLRRDRRAATSRAAASCMRSRRRRRARRPALEPRQLEADLARGRAALYDVPGTAYLAGARRQGPDFVERA